MWVIGEQACNSLISQRNQDGPIPSCSRMLAVKYERMYKCSLNMDAVAPNSSIGVELRFAAPFVALKEIAQLLFRPSLSESERATAALVRRAAEGIGQSLLNASDVDDFEERLDSSLESVDLSLLATQLNALFFQLSRDEIVRRFERPATNGVLELASNIFGDEGRRTLKVADELGSEFGKLLSKFPSELIAEAAREMTSSSIQPLFFLADRSMPPVVARWFLAMSKIQPLMFSVVAALTRGERIQPWLSHAILSRLSSSLKATIWLLRRLPPDGESADPETEQMMSVVSRYNRLVAAGYAEFLKRGRESGADIFPADSTDS